MTQVSKTDSDRIRNRINNRIDADRQKDVDVKQIVDDLSQVEVISDPIEATWEKLEKHEPYLDMSHTQRLYTIAFLFTNYGVSPEWITEDRRVSHAETWDDVTIAMCEYALYDVVKGLVKGEITRVPHRIGQYSDSRRDAVKIDFSNAMRHKHLTNTDVHNWVATLATDVSTRLANNDDIPVEDRTDCQRGVSNKAVETEEQAIHDVINETARNELVTQDIICAASFLDALEDLYLMDGSESIESEQLRSSASQGWEEAVRYGLLWHAMSEAISIHREVFSEDFKHMIDR